MNNSCMIKSSHLSQDIELEEEGSNQLITEVNNVMRIFKSVLPNKILIILRTLAGLKLTVSADVESVFTAW